MEKSVAPMINNNCQQYTKKCDTLYRTRWYGYEARDDRWETIHHLPRSKALNHCNWISLDDQTSIKNATYG